MKKFVLTSFVLFLLALLVAAGVFLYLNMNEGVIVKLPTETIIDSRAQSASEETSTTTLQDIPVESEPAFVVPDEGISLASLPLTNAQKNALEGAGVDVSTFILTKEVLECGVEQIGEHRIEAMAAGGAPTFLEITKLLPCLAGS